MSSSRAEHRAVAVQALDAMRRAAVSENGSECDLMSQLQRIVSAANSRSLSISFRVAFDARKWLGRRLMSDEVSTVTAAVALRDRVLQTEAQGCQAVCALWEQWAMRRRCERGRILSLGSGQISALVERGQRSHMQ